jgi:hypothetical protein
MRMNLLSVRMKNEVIIIVVVKNKKKGRIQKGKEEVDFNDYSALPSIARVAKRKQKLLRLSTG